MSVLIDKFRRIMMGDFMGRPTRSPNSAVLIPDRIRDGLPEIEPRAKLDRNEVECFAHPIHKQLLEKGVSVDRVVLLKEFPLDRRTNIDELANLLKKIAKNCSSDALKKILQVYFLSKNFAPELKRVFLDGFWKILRSKQNKYHYFESKEWISRLDKLIDLITRNDLYLSLYLHIPFCEITSGFNYVDNFITVGELNDSMNVFDWICNLESSHHPALKHILIALKQNKVTLVSQILQWNKATLRPVQYKLYQAVQMQLETTENFPNHFQRLFRFASEHFENQEKDSIIEFALVALNEKDETIISILEENEMHLLEQITLSHKKGLGNLDKYPMLAKLAFQLQSLLNPAHLQTILDSELSPEEKKAVLEKCMAISMHLGKQAQESLQSVLENVDHLNFEEALDDILRTELANFFQSAYDKEAICKKAGNHRGDLVFYNHLMASIFPLLIGKGQVVNLTMARFIEAYLFGIEDSSKSDTPHWIAEEQIRNLLQRVQDSAGLRSILNGIECNLDPQSPGLEAIRLQFGLAPDSEVNVTQAQLIVLMAIGLNMRQICTASCQFDSEIIRLEPEKMAEAVSSFLRHGVMKCIRVNKEGEVFPFNHSHMIPAANNVPLHHEKLTYRVNANGDVRCDEDTVALWEMPGIQAACNSLGIANAERSVKEALKKMNLSDSSFSELKIMELLKILTSSIEQEDSVYLPAFERAYSAFHAIEENLAVRLVQGATLWEKLFIQDTDDYERIFTSIFDSIGKFKSFAETEFFQVFNQNVRFVFRSQEKYNSYSLPGMFVPYLVHASENGCHRLELLQEGSKGWIVVKEKLEEAIAEEDRSEWEQNALQKLEELSTRDKKEISKQPSRLDSGSGWGSEIVGIQQEIRIISDFYNVLDKLRDLNVQQKLKANPFKKYPVRFTACGSESNHALNWIPGHPTMQVLIDAFKEGEDESMQSVVQRELINPGDEIRRKSLSEDDLDELFKILDNLKDEYFPNWSAEERSAFREICSLQERIDIHIFACMIKHKYLKDVIENEEEFYIKFDWLISNAFNPKGKSITFADTNWGDENGRPRIISIRHNIRTKVPEFWVTDEFGKLHVGGTKYIRKGYFDTF